MNRIVKPTKAISFEEALRNRASRLTGTPAAELPRTQEAIVQYMAEHVPALDDVAEAVTQEVIARLGKTDRAVLVATEPPTEPQNGAKEGGGTSAPPVDETPQNGPQAATEAAPKTKTARKSKK